MGKVKQNLQSQTSLNLSSAITLPSASASHRKTFPVFTQQSRHFSPSKTEVSEYDIFLCYQVNSCFLYEKGQHRATEIHQKFVKISN